MPLYNDYIEQRVQEAKTNNNFHEKYANNLRGTGERSADYMVYVFEMIDESILIIDFTDYSFESFSVVNREHLPLLNLLAQEA